MLKTFRHHYKSNLTFFGNFFEERAIKIAPTYIPFLYSTFYYSDFFEERAITDRPYNNLLFQSYFLPSPLGEGGFCPHKRAKDGRGHSAETEKINNQKPGTNKRLQIYLFRIDLQPFFSCHF